MKRVSQPCDPTSTRAMIRSVRLQLAAPSWNSLKRLTLVCVFALSKRRVVLASTVATRLRSVLVVATPKMKAMPFARHQSSTSGAHVWMPPLMQGFFLPV